MIPPIILVLAVTFGAVRSQTANPVSVTVSQCKDRLDNCAQLGPLFCSGQYLDFSKLNCQKYCNLCPGSPGGMPSGQRTSKSPATEAQVCDYKGKQYSQGQSWSDGCQYNCTCEDAALRCRNLCPQYTNLPPGCALVTQPGECCSAPVCTGPTARTIIDIFPIGTNNRMIPSIILVLAVTFGAVRSQTAFCIFNGKSYVQDQTWNDGCRQACRCSDAVAGFYSCRAICLNWSQLPSSCHMEPAPPGLCCKQPKCPPQIILQIPSAYKDQYPGYKNYVKT